jgi:phospholipid/cholesterol/gamma-HCH transport system substrate-binding protein
MRRAIREYAPTFAAILALIAIAGAVSIYILSQQNFHFPIVEGKPMELRVEVADASAITPGQGQTVTVAGVKVGLISDVLPEDGHAAVLIQMEPEYEGLIREDASALVRTRTALKDMFIEIRPGSGRPLRAGEAIPIANTASDIDPDEVISALDVLDRDTRDYLTLFVSGAGKGLAGRGRDLRGTLRELPPLHRALRDVSRAIANRRHNLRRLVNRYGVLSEELGRADREIVRLVGAGNAVFGRLAAEDDGLERSIALLPGALRSSRDALVSLDELSTELGPSVDALRPAMRQLGPAAEAIEPLAREGTPILRDSLRPFVRIAGSEVEVLGGAARRLARGAPDLTEALSRLNRMLNILAYNPGGAEPLTGDLARDRARQEGYLHWLAWTGQNTITLLGTADGFGVLRRISGELLECSALQQIGLPVGLVGELELARTCLGSGG